MSPGRASAPQPRAGLAVQLGGTLLVLGAAVLVLGLVLDDGTSATWAGAALLVVGVVLLVVGRRAAPRDPGA